MRLRILAALFCAILIIITGNFFAAHFAHGAGVTGKLSVSNAAPVVSGVSINNNPALITLVTNTTTSVSVNASVSDNNGCGDVTNGTATILLYRSGIGSSTCLAAGGVGGAGASPLNCYVATAFTASSTCSGTSSNTTTTFAVQYYAQATDVSSTFPSQNWQATVIFTDPSSTSGSADSTSASSTNDIATLVALNIPTSTVNYGVLNTSSTTGSANQLVNLENAGNASTTIAVNGTALANGGNTLATSSQHYATSSFTFGGGEQQLSGAATTITGINTAPVFNFPIGGAGWQQTTALSYTETLHATVAYNGYLYNIGGVANGGTITSTVLFTPISATGSLGAWSLTQALPYSDYYNTAVAYNGYLYNIGGCPGGSCATSTIVYAPVNATGSIGAWTSTTALPYTSRLQAPVAYNGYLYVIAGLANSLVTTTVAFAAINATGSLGPWTITQALPYTLMQHTSVAYNGYLYTIGGVANGTATATVLFALINTTGSIGAWNATQALPARNQFHSSVSYNGYLYTLGGFVNNLEDTSTVVFAPFNATGSIGAWSSTQALPGGLESMGSAAYNGYLYNTGGSNGTATTAVTFAPLNARSTYWGLNVPNSAVGGTYIGTITFTASFSN